MSAQDVLAAHDQSGPPYVVPHGASLDYGMAVEIALSKHPSRVLANTNGYRYGRFTFPGTGAVDVTMMGSHIARFTPAGVQLWSRGYVTVSTTEALSNLVTGAWFYAQNFRIYVARYSAPREREQFTEGTVFPYQS